MGIHIDKQAARKLLSEAFELATSATPLPAEWALWTRQVARAPSKTYVVALATALLARATDSRVNGLILKESYDDPGAYSARTLAHEVLVPFAWKNGIDLRARGREPLNNQPFFRYDFMDPAARVLKGARASYRFLIATIETANKLSHEHVLLALAALLRERSAVRRLLPAGDLPSLDVDALIGALDTLLGETAEEGKRAQAAAAAVLELVYEDVRTSRVNDPSRHLPGDCHVMVNDTEAIMGVEVKAKPVSQEEPIDFARKLREAGIGRGIYLALATNQNPLDVGMQRHTALIEHQVLLDVKTGMSQLIHEALRWSRLSLEEALGRFPDLLMRRLIELEVQDATIARWSAVCKSVAK